jgi:Xaa-Pro aminopeptidase
MPTARLLIFGKDDPNMRYATGLAIGDPFIWVRLGDELREKSRRTTEHAREYVIVSSLEYSSAKQHAKPGTRVILLDKVDLKGIRKPGRKVNLADIAAAFLISHNITEVVVPENTWALHIESLREHGLRPVIIAQYFPQRAVKSRAEIAAIRRAGVVTRKAFLRCARILRKARIGKDRALLFEGKRLTAEFMKSEIERVFLEHGCASGETIVACGRQAAQPHNTGTGLLRAGEPIVFDIYPRDLASGYYFDMTRTVIKGAPSEELRRMYDAVAQAQLAGIAALRAGAKASDVDAAARGVLGRAGYKTSADEGFIHSTGHGVGLAIHEAPRLGAKSDEILAAGMVVTIEPGLYYKKLGGVRIEDTLVVTPKGCMSLTGLPRTIILK